MDSGTIVLIDTRAQSGMILVADVGGAKETVKFCRSDLQTYSPQVAFDRRLEEGKG